MKSIFHRLLNALSPSIVAPALLLASTNPALFAGGPLQLCASGQAFIWPSGGANIPFNPDLGTLGPLDNAQAVALVDAAFAVWQNVPTATATYVNAGPLPVDVDINNFAPYLFPAAPDGFSAIIFDSTGEIFDLLFGPGSGVLGFAGPEWLDFSNCSVLEGVSFLNGPSFVDATAASDVMVHEFGHYSGLAHTVVNGQILIGDTSGPSPNNTFGPPNFDDVETMYPFYFGPGVGSASLHADDIAALSTLYPTPDFSANTATFSGTIRRATGGAVTGINVIARNVADPFKDAVSAISGDYSDFFNPGDPQTGTYTLRGLTPGAQYAIYIDTVLAGGFSTPTLFPLPGPEEFYNGVNESDNISVVDSVTELSPVSGTAGQTVSDINIVLNSAKPGEPLPISDDGAIDLALPFPFEICGQKFSQVWVNANGNITFGNGDPSPLSGVDAFLAGPPRIAPLWIDLNPDAGGKITYSVKEKVFTISYSKVPAFPDFGENTFEIDLHANNHVDIRYGSMTAQVGIAGLSGGGLVTSRFETPEDLSALARSKTVNLQKQPAFYEQFAGASLNDLANKTLRLSATSYFNDHWAEPNNRLSQARSVALPFDSTHVSRLTELEPAGGDVDFYTFDLEAGDLFVARVLSAPFDSVLGLMQLSGSGAKTTGKLIVVDDDGGPGTLSLIVFQAVESGRYAVAASAFPDLALTGAGGGGGRYVLDLRALKPDPANPVLNGSFEFDFIGWNAIQTGPPFIPWTISGAGDGAGFEMALTQPQEGKLVAWNGFDGEGPMEFHLFQDVSIRSGSQSATLLWKDRLQWNFLVGTQTQPRTYAVQIRDPLTDAVLKTVHSFDTGIAAGLGDSGWVSHSADISEFIGSTVRLLFLESIPEAFTGPGQFEIDDIQLPVK